MKCTGSGDRLMPLLSVTLAFAEQTTVDAGKSYCFHSNRRNMHVSGLIFDLVGRDHRSS